MLKIPTPIRVLYGALRTALLCVAVTSPLIASQRPELQPFMEKYCVDCHDAELKKGEFDLEKIVGNDPASHSGDWEKVIRKLRTRQMPPPDKTRPREDDYEKVLTSLTAYLDKAAAEKPNPGRTDTFRRLTRFEYQNAIRDLLDLDIDAAALLPKDEASHGFDNITVGTLSPTLLDRYITAAQKIARLAVGSTNQKVSGETYRLKPDLTQEEHVEGLPLGTRGGTLIKHIFPVDAEYEFQIRLARDRNEEVEGLYESHELEVLIDSAPVKTFTVSPPQGRVNFEKVDQHLKVRVPVKAGPHKVGITFIKQASSLVETKRQPYAARFNMHRHPRQGPAIYQVSINGPYSVSGKGETPSRKRIFANMPAQPRNEEEDARAILGPIMRQAYRRPIEEADFAKPIEFFRKGSGESFEEGIENALASILFNPEFLFRIESDLEGLPPGSAYKLTDLELASRLSFFLWSSLPDEELLAAAERGELGKPESLEKQVSRMLSDKKAEALITNFADQWLHLRNLESFTPDLRLFPDFDDNLRQALRKETELLFATVLNEDRSILHLINADFTFLNERLAKHYGVPHIYGDRFRKVSTARKVERGGLLRQGSVLTVTSYPTRTSPVIRGHWILGNVIGTPTPPPPPNVPALKDNTVAANLSVRERLAEHRANAACASCHNMMDPVGFSLENFDALGRWRLVEEGNPVDASGGLPDGSSFQGVAGLESGLMERPDIFATTLTEKLLTYALGRGVEPYDAPAVRQVIEEAKTKEYRFSSIILGIVQSKPFTMRKTL